jgi:hypothetical protein
MCVWNNKTEAINFICCLVFMGKFEYKNVTICAGSGDTITTTKTIMPKKHREAIILRPKETVTFVYFPFFRTFWAAKAFFDLENLEKRLCYQLLIDLAREVSFAESLDGKTT